MGLWWWVDGLNCLIDHLGLGHLASLSLLRGVSAHVAHIVTTTPLGGVLKMVVGEARNFPELARVWHDELVAHAIGAMTGRIAAVILVLACVAKPFAFVRQVEPVPCAGVQERRLAQPPGHHVLVDADIADAGQIDVLDPVAVAAGRIKDAADLKFSQQIGQLADQVPRFAQHRAAAADRFRVLPAVLVIDALEDVFG